MTNKTIKEAVYEVMPAAYAEVSENGTLPAPARDIGYAVRRLSGLGDRLDLKNYFLGGPDGGLLASYQAEHPVKTADWDVVRDDRGSFHGPYGRGVAMGTLAVRSRLSQLRRWRPPPAEERPEKPVLHLWYPTRGPGDEYRAVLYIEKEGKLVALDADGFFQRWDLGVVSCKGYSVHAARRFLRTLQADYGITVLVAHDFDKQGIGIFDTLRVPGAIDLGLRWRDLQDERWGLMADSEPVTYRGDPRPNLRMRGASEEEINFLVQPAEVGERLAGRRVELNALTGRRFIDWLEVRLEEHGVAKVIPDAETLEAAYRYAYPRELINREITAAFEGVRERVEAHGVEIPDDLPGRVARALRDDPSQPWDGAIASIVLAQLDGESGEE